MKNIAKKSKEILNLILLGDPSAGKATHAALLLRKYAMRDIDMGKELRRIMDVKNKSRLAAKIRAKQNKGYLVPTEIVRSIHKEMILSAPKNKGILLDGTPKMLGEAKLCYRWLKESGRNQEGVLFIYLHIPLEEILKRTRERIAIVDGKREKRPDDTRSSLKNRFNYYRKHVKSAVKFLKSKYPHVQIDSSGSIADVERRIEAAVRNFLDDKTSPLNPNLNAKK